MVHDLVPRNAKIGDADGIVYPIDPVIQRVTPDFAEFMQAHPICPDTK